MAAVIERVMLGDLVPELTELPDELTLRPGDEQTIHLPSLARAGYVWEAEVEDGAVAEAAVAFQPADDAAVGSRTFSRSELLTLTGRKEGTTRVYLAQRRTWEEGVEPIAAHTLTVNVAEPAEATKRGGTS
jgi:predicted secreted protein